MAINSEKIYEKSEIVEFAKYLVDSNVFKAMSSISLVEIDNFGDYKNSHSREEAVRLHAKVGEIIRNHMVGLGRVGYHDDDRFLLIYEVVTNYNSMRPYMEDLRAAVEAGCKDEGITISIGASSVDEYATNHDEMHTLALAMLQRCQSKGGNRFIFYRADIHGDVLGKHEDHHSFAIKNITLNQKRELIFTHVDTCLKENTVMLDVLFSEIATAFSLDEIDVIFSTGNVLTSYEKPEYVDSEPKKAMFLEKENIQEHFHHAGIIVINNIEDAKAQDPELAEYMIQKNIKKWIIFRLYIGERRYYIYYIKKSASTDWEDTDVILLDIAGKAYEKVFERG